MNKSPTYPTNKSNNKVFQNKILIQTKAIRLCLLWAVAMADGDNKNARSDFLTKAIVEIGEQLDIAFSYRIHMLAYTLRLV